ncbi:ABC transporter permease [Peptacetobacter hominis]|uniref:ABC transporter permease n=2 Tax=Peptacetobacter hominis TaxID=2743610 RepID=A0A544QUR9_9FIRM|nr:ABC transporter permease [Peptacetobacter hominis]
MKKNKSRTIMMFLVVISVTAFLLSMDMIGISQTYNNAEAYKKAYGDYHSEYVDISREKMAKVAADKRIEYSDNVQNLGFLVNEENGTKVELKSFDGYNDDSGNYFDRKAQIMEGRAPKNNNEIVVDTDSANNLGISENPIGKTITFELRKSYKLPNGEEKLYSEKKTFKVVGLVKREYGEINANIVGLEQKRGLSYTYGNFDGQSIIPEEAVTYDIITRFDSGNSMDDEVKVSGILEKIATDYELGRTSLTPNSNYLSELYKINDIKDITFIGYDTIVLVITVILLVFNMFNIIWGEYIREISMLRLIGATKKNIRRMVMYQSLILMVFGTAIGIAVGFIVTKLGLMLSRDDVTKITGVASKIYVDTDVILKTVVFSVGAIIIATIPPIIKVGRVGCMDAITVSGSKSGRGKQSKIGSIVQNKIGIHRYMGIRNLWIKKTRTLVSILTIALCGYMIMYTFSSMQTEVDDKIRRIYYKYDIKVSQGIYNDVESFKISKNTIENIKDMDGVAGIYPNFDGEATFVTDKDNINEYFKEYYGLDGSEKTEYKTHLRFYPNEMIKDRVEPYMMDNKTTEDIEGKTDGYINVAVFNSFYDPIKTHTYYKIYKDLKVGDIITIGVNYHNGDKIEKKNLDVRVGAILEQNWQSQGDALMPYRFEVITSEKNMKEIVGFEAYNNLGVNYTDLENTSDNKKVEMYVKENIPGAISIKESFLQQQNSEQAKSESRGATNAILVLIISGISIFCTVKSNLMERRKEIFTMRALGMSLKDMNKMNMYESVTYAVLSITVGIAISTYKLIEFVNWNNYAYTNFGIEHFMDFTFPYKEAIAFALVALITCIVSVKLANRNFRNKEISDGMRDIE